MIRRAAPRASRFVPPWAKAGCASPDEFFGGITRHANPVQQLRRDEARRAEYESQVESEEAMLKVGAEQATRHLHGAAEEMAEHERARREFLPYGATPRQYFPEDQGGVAAWGTLGVHPEVQAGGDVSRYAPRPSTPGTDFMDAKADAAASMSSETASFSEQAEAAAAKAGSTGYSRYAQDLLERDVSSELPFKHDPHGAVGKIVLRESDAGRTRKVASRPTKTVDTAATAVPAATAELSSIFAAAKTAAPATPTASKTTTSPQLGKGGADLPWPLGGSAGYVLDIDGVVHKGGDLIPGSAEALRQLHTMRVPHVFMTNGGGDSEVAKAGYLSSLLGYEVREEQVMLAHTPMRHLAAAMNEAHRDTDPASGPAVLVVGGEEGCCRAALEYGFRRVMSVEEVQRRRPDLVPHKMWTDGACPGPRTDADAPSQDNGKPWAASVAVPPFAAILVLHDGKVDALNDMQVMIDVALSPFGQIPPPRAPGMASAAPVSAEQTVPVYFSADDLIFAGKAPLPRLGQGALREMFAAVFLSVTGTELQSISYGKPRRVQYRYAEHELRRESARLGWDPAALRTAIMVGDNVETDIVGANAAGRPWLSVHVQTGVGSAPAAQRTISPMDQEALWLGQHVPTAPHYVAPSLRHFVAEAEHFGEAVVTQQWPEGWFPPPCPVDLKATYGMDPFAPHP